MSKHTPGPWYVSEDWDGTSIKAGQFYVTHTIQCCGFYEADEGKAVTQANARLIAAAPDLLEALIHIEGAAMDITCERRTIRDAALAAIAKATGGEA